MGIMINLDAMMAKRRIGLTELSDKVGITLANLSILKNNRRAPCAFPRWMPSAAHWTASRAIFWNMCRMTKNSRKQQINKAKC